MADSASTQDKTHEATPRRRREAARKGQTPKSQEVTTAFLLLAGAAVFALLSGGTAAAIRDLFAVAVSGLSVLPEGAVATAGYLRSVGVRAFFAVAPMLLALSGVALAIAGVQGRGILTAEPLKPQLERLDPIEKAKQLWGWKALAELIKSLVKLGIVAAAVYFAVGRAATEVGVLAQASPFALLDFMRRYTVRMLLAAGGAYLALALADYAFQVWQHEKRLRMTREEVKRETKDSEGDQVVKVRRRTMARQMARRRMMGAVAEADVVVTNPTHIAVALKYDPAVAHAPVVVAMGERKVAERIKELARDAGVPLVENKPLARALLATAAVDRPIPMELFIAVAEVLAFVYRSRGAGLPGYGATA